jgi:hypothetical protein
VLIELIFLCKKSVRLKRTTLESIQIIKQLNVNLIEGKPQKRRSKTSKKKAGNIILKKRKKNQENLNKPPKLGLIKKTCNSLDPESKFN